MCRYVPLIHRTIQDVENSEFKKQLNGLALLYPDRVVFIQIIV